MEKLSFLINRNLFYILSLFFLIFAVSFCFAVKDTQAQHVDVFKMDFGKDKKDKKDSELETGYIEVNDCTTYKIAVEKEKLDNKDFSVYDLELFDISEEDLSKFAWHQVPVIKEDDIVAIQTRTAGDLECKRSRSGKLYWLSDGKKHVNWGIWSFWKCDRDETKKE